MQQLIEENCVYNKDIGEWEVSCLAFTGVMMQPGDGKLESSKHGGPSLNYADALAQAKHKRDAQSNDSRWKDLFRSYADEI